LSTGFWWGATEETVNCGVEASYKGMDASTFSVSSVLLTGGDSLSGGGSALWHHSTNGVCKSGSTWASNSARVNNCCMNAGDMDEFTHCMNFLSTTALNKTALAYTTLQYETYDDGNNESSCKDVLGVGLSWFSANEKSNWEASCEDSTLRTALGNALEDWEDSDGANGSVDLQEWENKFERFYKSWNHTSNTWSGVRNSQLGGKACRNAYATTSCSNADDESDSDFYATTRNASWSMLDDDARDALDTACSAVDSTAERQRAENCCLNAQSNNGYDSCVRSA